MKEIYFDQAFPFLRYARILSIYKDSDYNESMAYDNRLFLCIEGRGAICIEDKDYEMKKGTLIMWRAGKKYSYKTCPDEPMHLIGFNFDFTHESADKKLPIPPIAPTLFKKDDMTEQILFSDADILNHTVYIKNMYETKPKFFEMKEEFELNKKYSRAVCSAMLLEQIFNMKKAVALDIKIWYNNLIYYKNMLTKKLNHAKSEVKKLIKSMTGYGHVEGVFEGKKIVAEIRSVNHRYADYNIKVPRYYGFLEDMVRKYISKYIARGKVDVFVSVESYEDSDKQIILNGALAKSYIDALSKIRDDFGLKDDISVSTVARFNDIFLSERKEEDEQYIWQIVLKALEGAVEKFVQMRTREGERMLSDIKEKEECMLRLVGEVETHSPERVNEYQKRLYAKLNEVLEGKDIDEARILTEAAIYADKVAVDEETVRLRSHFTELDRILASNEPAGRKLDFLIQEINREINTIGSKANDIQTAKIVVELKAELEKMREQVQNIE